MDNFKRLADIRKEQDEKALASKRHTENQLATKNMQETIERSFESLVRYLDNRVTRTEVVNQLRQVGTPDALKVVQAVENLHKTLKTHENTDLSEITEVMRQVLDEAKKIPKELPKQQEITLADYTKQFDKLEKSLKAVQKAIEKQELKVQAPKPVIVPAPEVVVDAPDMKPLQNGLESVTKAVKSIKYPDRMKTEQQNSLINFEFDEYKLIRDEFDEDDPRVEATVYYLNGKKVARINYKYDDSGNLTGAKRV